MFENLKKAWKVWIGTDEEYIEKRIPLMASGNNFALSKAEKMATVFNCIDILAKTLAKLPLEIYQSDESGASTKAKAHPLYDLLHYNPNSYTTLFNFIAALEVNRNLKGNSFALISRDANGYVSKLTILLPSYVVGYEIVNEVLYYGIKYPEKENIEVVTSDEILHFRMISKDGIWGLSPIEALRQNLSTTYKGFDTIDAAYDNNIISDKFIKSTVGNANQKAMQEAVQQFQKEFAGSRRAGRVVPLPPNTEVQEFALNLDDAKFIETIKFNANQIAAMFGVPSHMVGNTEASKYNNVEQMNIGFKGDTISPLARMYRQEFELKLLSSKDKQQGRSIEFNLNAMIETDYTTRVNGYQKLVGIGAMSPNDVSRIENMPTDLNGDVRLVPMNMMGLDKINQNVKNT